MKLFIRLTALLLLMIAAFVSLITIAYAIPESCVRANAERSVEYMKTISPTGLTKFHKFDMYTDSLMLNMAMNADATHPFRSAMENPYIFYDEKYDGTPTLSVEGEIWEPTAIPGYYRVSYGRYWQGHQTMLRPALTIIDFRTIRIANLALGLVLLAWCIVLIYKHLPKPYLICFLLAIAISGLPILALSMQFVAVYVIMLASIIAILSFPNRHDSIASGATLFMAIGGVTSFMDFLTTPLLTLAVPLVFFMAVYKGKTGSWGAVVILSAVWAVGFGGVWVAKWLIGEFTTGSELITNAIESVTHRSIDPSDGVTYPQHVWMMISHDPRAWIAMAVMLIAVVICYLKTTRGASAIRRYSYLLPIAAMPIVWYAVIHNHSTTHFWFTWRIFIATIFALTLYWSLTTDISKLFATKKRPKQCPK